MTPLQPLSKPVVTPPEPATPVVESESEPEAARTPLLSFDDLEDPEKFTAVRRVPLLDVHDDPETGRVDHSLLRLLAKNCNDRVAQGNFPSVILGHTKMRPVERDGEMVQAKDDDEQRQPPPVGYAVGFHVGDFQGRPCLYADLHIQNGDLEYSRTFPHRSVERIDPAPGVENPDPADNFIDRIALLRTPPRRDLGILHYAASDRSLRRTRYARDFSSPSSPTKQPPAPPAQPVEDLNAMDEQTPDIKELVRQALAEALPGALRQALSEAAETEESAVDGAEPGADDYSPEQYDNPGYDPAMYDEPEEAPYEDPEAELEQRRNAYEAAAPGPDNTYVPSDGSIGVRRRPQAPPRERHRMQQDSDRIRRHQYERDLAERDRRIAELEHTNRRTLYERTLTQLEGEGYEIDRAAEMEELTPDSPQGYEAKQEARIRKCYRRNPIGQPTVRTEAPDVTDAPQVLSRKDQEKIFAYAGVKGLTYAAAKKDLGFK